MPRQLLPEQAAAAYEISRHVSVTAGPGSGKTTVLVERYLHILRTHKPNIDQIVAITFTNRAANEMRERLRSDLSEILKTVSPKERPRWLEYKRTLDGAVITTIHGFCARMLREFPVEAGVDPQFVLLDEHRAAMLLESVVEEVLSKFISDGHIEVSRLTLGVGRAKLAEALAQVYREVRGQGLSFEEVAAMTAGSHATEDAHVQALEDLDSAMKAFLAVPRTTAAQQASYNAIVNEWSRFRSYVNKMPEHETLAEYCQVMEAIRELRPQRRGPLIEHLDILDEIFWGLNLSGRIPRICFDLFANRYALEMVNLLSEIDRRLNEEKHRISALDFDDLEIRTLELLNNSAVITRASDRYRFFLVDEFQDTNGLQRKLLEKLTMTGGRGANLFIVGDRKQSIYGFRGADVDVFRETTKALIEAGGEAKPLLLNFRSQPPLIAFFNYLFSRLFQPPDEVATKSEEELAKLGYVKHEPSEAKRELRDDGPLVELLIASRPAADDKSTAYVELRELDAAQIATRIVQLREANPELKYSDIALLFRAMTQVHFYESAFRLLSIPYQTVLGRGFYEREEITDLIQLLRFLDNRTDELALAAVLRSPLCGISDNALLALRSGPRVEEIDQTDTLVGTRRLNSALLDHRDIAFISDDEHSLLDRAASLIHRLVARRHHYTIEELLRFAVDESEYMTVIAANFDGAQRLANVQRLFTLAARFERSGNHLIRDFVRYVEEFEAIGARESEGQMDEAANAVKLMTIHQAKGLEFPVVIIPDLQRSKNIPEFSFMLDRHHGLTLKVPDGRGGRVAGSTFTEFEKRNSWREEFESMRLLYVAATRAEDRLIFTGAIEDVGKLGAGPDTWLKWIWKSLGLEGRTQSEVITLEGDAQLQLLIDLQSTARPDNQALVDVEDDPLIESDSLSTVFPLLAPVAAERTRGTHRFSVTQLINYQRCPRQYYFDRVLQLPSSDEMAVWNHAEAPEPPANLTATLKGAVIHRFCERYGPELSAEECLRQSFAEVVRLRQSELADRLVELDEELAIAELLPLANNYLSSAVFARVEQARTASEHTSEQPGGEPGLWSEMSFRLRRPLGVLSGAIDKLLVTNNADGEFEVEIIDFKTNRIPKNKTAELSQPIEAAGSSQFAFNFEAKPIQILKPSESALSVVASDYQLQMQAYGLAIRELIPELSASKFRVTLHFLEPNLEYNLAEELLEPSVCEAAIDSAMLDIISSTDPSQFPVRPANHCRSCNFLRVCAAGREWVANS